MADNNELAEVDGGPALNVASIFRHIEEGLKKNPNEPAVIAMHQRPDHLEELVHVNPLYRPSTSENASCLVWTYKQLHQAAMDLAVGLMAYSVSPGSTLVTLIPNGIEWCLFMWSASIGRLTVAPLDSGALTPAREAELQNLMARLKPAAIVVSDAQEAAAVQKATDGFRRPVVITISESPLHGGRTLSSMVRFGSTLPVVMRKDLLSGAREHDPDRIGLIMFTSGTSTGVPKGCPRHVASLTHVVTVQKWGVEDLDTSSRCLLQTANFRIIAPLFLFTTWKAGGAVVIPGISSPQWFLTAIARHRITNMVLVPAMVHALAAQSGLKSFDLSSVRSIVLGGDMITRDIIFKMQALIPHAKVINGQGMTEGGGICDRKLFSRPLTDIPFLGEISPLGPVGPGARLRIWDADRQCVTKVNEPGELHVCCQGFIRGYLGGTNTESFYEEQGKQWFKTGDLAIISSAKLVYILGRIKDVIKRAGVPITPAAIESCLEAYTGSQTIVVGVSSTTLAQEPFAVLESFAGKTEENIKQRVIDLFGNDYALAGARTLKDIGLKQFPLNVIGKVMKTHVLEAVESVLNG